MYRIEKDYEIKNKRIFLYLFLYLLRIQRHISLNIRVFVVT